MADADDAEAGTMTQILTQPRSPSVLHFVAPPGAFNPLPMKLTENTSHQMTLMT